MAADRLAGGGAPLLELATELEGHPDNAAAALLGGVVICADGAVAPPRSARLARALCWSCPTARCAPSGRARCCRTRCRSPTPCYNTAHGALLMLGLAGGDPELVARGLADVLHQPYRAHLYPRSAELLREASGLGALGATISGAGPTVLVWVAADEAALVGERLRERVAPWAQVVEAPFVSAGAQID